MFYERWRPDEDFLDYYLARTERAEPEEPDAGPEMPAAEPRPAAGRPKRPWFDVLEVQPGASTQEVKRAYHARMKEYHPDRTAGLGRELRELADVVTREINTAYEEAGRHR